MQMIQGQIEKIEMSEERDGKYGKFKNQYVTVNGEVYSNINTNNEPGFYDKKKKEFFTLSEGDLVSIMFETNGKYNNTTHISKESESQDSATYSASSKSLPSSKIVPGKSQNGARTGMIVKAAIDLALGRKKTDLDSLKESVKDVISLVETLESLESKENLNNERQSAV